MPAKIIIAGAPASGKGTQCEFIRSKYKTVHLSTGDILRAAVAAGTDVGLKAKSFMESGQLVPDEVIINLILERLKEQDCVENGWLLDGFPRTHAQALALQEAGVVPDIFVYLDVKDEILVERVTGRRSDPVTGKIYHLTYSPPTEDEVRERLVHRADDTAEALGPRLEAFHDNMTAIAKHYEAVMVTVDGGSSPPKDIWMNVMGHIDKKTETSTTEIGAKTDTGSSPNSQTKSCTCIVS